MKILDNEKDKYIKDKLQKDELISKKADDVFNNFLKNDIYNINTQEKETKQEETKDNVVRLATHKLNKSKKILSMVASLMIMFLVANVYAATKGYNNIFFVIRNLFIEEEAVLEKEQILSDRDITISYEYISIANGVKVQVNNLKMKDGNAELLLLFKEKINSELKPSRVLVYDITENEEKLLGKHKTEEIELDESTKELYEELDYENQIQEIIKLKGLKENTNKLRVVIQDKENDVIATLEIDIDAKFVDIIESKASELKQLSETELKIDLAKFAKLNLDSYDSKIATITRREEHNVQLALIAMNYIYEKEYNPIIKNEEIKYTKTKIDKAIKELIGDNIELANNDIIYFDDKTDEYKYGTSYVQEEAICIEIEELIFENGVYTATITYCLVADGMELEDVFEENAIYRTTIKFKINDSYTYSKYLLINADEMQSEIARQPIANTEFPKFEIEEDENSATKWPEILYQNEVVENTIKNETPDSNTNTLNTNQSPSNVIMNIIPPKSDSNSNVDNTVDVEIKVEPTNNNQTISNEKITELKDTVEKYILMNFYKDRDAISHYTEEEYENEMKVLTAFKLDFGFPTSPTQYVSIDKSIIYEIIEAYTGKQFNDNTKMSQIIFKRESTETGGAFSYISGKVHELSANVLRMENVEYINDEYKITFTYSYSFYPEDKYRATMTLKPISPLGIPSLYVKYQLMDNKIVSEKIN